MAHALRVFNVGSIAAMVSLGAGCATAPVQVPSAAAPGNYVLDPAHASVTMTISHAGLSNYTMRFDDISGTLSFDPDAPQNSAVDIRINSASISTGLPDFDKTLTSESKYLDAGTYPQIAFTSTSVQKISDTRGTVTGDLTFRGVTKPITLDTTFNGAGKSFGHPGDTLGFSATGTVVRSDFGMTTLINFGIGDEVDLRIEAEFNQVMGGANK